MQSTYLEVELDEWPESRPELRLYAALAHEMERRPLRRREGLEEAELLQLQGGSGDDRRNQVHSG